MSYRDFKKSSKIQQEGQQIEIIQKFLNLQDNLKACQAKIQHITTLIKLQQTYIQSQQYQISILKNQTQKNLQIEKKIKNLQAQVNKTKTFQAFQRQIDYSLQQTEKKINSMIQKAGKELEIRQKNFHRFFQDSLQKCKRELTTDYKIMNRKIGHMSQIGSSSSLFQSNSNFYKKLQGLQIFKIQAEELFLKISSQIQQIRQVFYQTQEISKRLADTATQRLTDAQISIKNLEDFVLGIAQDLKTRNFVGDSGVQENLKLIRRKVQILENQQENIKYSFFQRPTNLEKEDLIIESSQDTNFLIQDSKRRSDFSNKKVTKANKQKRLIKSQMNVF